MHHEKKEEKGRKRKTVSNYACSLLSYIGKLGKITQMCVTPSNLKTLQSTKREVARTGGQRWVCSTTALLIHGGLAEL